MPWPGRLARAPVGDEWAADGCLWPHSWRGRRRLHSGRWQAPSSGLALSGRQRRWRVGVLRGVNSRNFRPMRAQRHGGRASPTVDDGRNRHPPEDGSGKGVCAGPRAPWAASAPTAAHAVVRRRLALPGPSPRLYTIYLQRPGAHKTDPHAVVPPHNSVPRHSLCYRRRSCCHWCRPHPRCLFPVALPLPSLPPSPPPLPLPWPPWQP